MSFPAEICTIESHALFNLLQQITYRSRLGEINFLMLIDVRDDDEFIRSHIVTAKNLLPDKDGKYHVPEFMDMAALQYLVLYDDSTNESDEPGRVYNCAKVLAKASLCPVQILQGGFNKFTAVYHFLSNEKILYTQAELDNLIVYPVEIIPGVLYMGDLTQRLNKVVLHDLKINAAVNILEPKPMERFKRRRDRVDNLNIVVSNCAEGDLYSHFSSVCEFIDAHMVAQSQILIMSEEGRGRCATVTIAFLMHHFKYTLEEALMQMLEFKITVSPNMAFLEQLAEWENEALGKKSTDVSRFYLPYLKSLVEP